MTLFPEVAQMSEEERLAAQRRVALDDPEKLLRWLEASGRRYILLDAKHLAEALPWPDGHEYFQQILQCYRDHRSTIPTGKTETTHDPVTGEDVEIPVMRDEMFTIEELDRAIRYLIGQASKLDSNWSLNNAPL